MTENAHFRIEKASRGELLTIRTLANSALVNSDPKKFSSSQFGLDYWSILTSTTGQFGPFLLVNSDLKNKDSFVNSDLFCWSIRTCCWVLFRLSGVIDPVGFVVHTNAFTTKRSAIPG